MEENLILTADVLSLSPDLSQGQPVNGTFTVKNTRMQTYLTVSEVQWQVLCEFSQEQTVPGVLEKVIRNRRCPALAEFYELILKACRAGILRSELSVQVRRPAIRWFVSIPHKLLLSVSALLLVAALVALVRLRGALSVHWSDLLMGWAITCAALSAGYAIAGCILRASRCEIYHPHMCWRTPLPHFAIDLGDVCMASRTVRLAASLTVYTPLAGAVAGALLAHGTWALVPVVSLLAMWHPFGGGWIDKVLQLFRRQPLLDTDHHFLFHRNRRPSAELKAGWRVFEWRPTAARFAYGIGWALLVSHAVFEACRASMLDAIVDGAYWRRAALWLAGAVLVAVLSYVAVLFWRPVLEALRNGRQRYRRFWHRWRKGDEIVTAGAAAERLLKANPLLRRLKPDVQTEILRQLKPFTAGPWRRVLSFDEAPMQVGLIVSGTATVYRRAKSGRRAPYMYLAEGDLFGVQGMVDSHHPRLEVRTRTPFKALVLPAEVFQQLVIDQLGEEDVFNFAHKHVILRHSRLCHQWRPQAIDRFTQIADVVSYSVGDKIVQKGAEPKAFYVVSEGEVDVLDGCCRIGRVKPGGFLGEVGLLQNSVATANVEAAEDTRCLVVNRTEFMRFMSHNYNVALELEQVSSRRLGRPIFPLNPNSLEGI